MGRPTVHAFRAAELAYDPGWRRDASSVLTAYVAHHER